MKDSKVIIIPDVHGRTIWKEAVKGNEDQEIIFLGDYTDPYPEDNITKLQALENFIEIVEFKKQHHDNVHLLVGNHDFQYILDKRFGNSKHDCENHDKIRDLFLNNLGFFGLTYQIKEVGPENKLCVFSHAGILPIIYTVYYENLVSTTNEPDWSDLLENKGKGYSLNEIFQGENSEKKEWLFKKMKERSISCGGSAEYGSILWARDDEWQKMDEMLNTNAGKDPRHPDMIQFFGHTQSSEEKPRWLTSYACCLDCHRAFELNTETCIIRLV